MARIVNYDTDATGLSYNKRKYLLGIYKWYYSHRDDHMAYSEYLDIHTLERILLDNSYGDKDKEFLNNLRQVVPYIKKRVEESNKYDDLPF